MLSHFKKLFSKKEDRFYSISNEPAFENALNFLEINDEIIKKLTEYLERLKESKGKFIFEKLLKNKSLSRYKNVHNCVAAIKLDLESDFNDITKEFEGEPIGFTYYLATEILFSNSVEIVKKIYHKERDDLGKIYFSLVIKFNDGYYYYWKW